MAGQPQQPSLLGQMAATAGGVTIGSAVGHTIGHAVTGLFANGTSDAARVPGAALPAVPASYDSLQPGSACAFEIKQFLNCAENHSDLTLCAGFNEAMRQCKMANSECFLN